MGFLNRHDFKAARCVLLVALAWVTVSRAAGTSREAGAENAPATLELKGLLLPLDSANLSSRSTGVIRDMKKEGDAVRKDEIVVSLDDDAEKLAVESAKAILDVRQFEAKSTRELANKGSGSESDARTAKANLTTAEIQLKEAEVALAKKSVHSPFDGVVTRHMRSVGEATDNYLPLLSVVDLSKVYLETYLPANRLRDVQAGQPVEVTVSDLPGRKFAGVIDYVAPVIDPASGEFRVKILLPNDDHALRSGMAAIGQLQVTPGELHAEQPNPKDGCEPAAGLTVASAPPPSPSAPAAPPTPDYGNLRVLPLRADLVTSEQIYLGRAYIIVKNPISLTYFRLSRAHYDAARRFDAKTSLNDIVTEMQAASPYWRAMSPEQAAEEMSQLANQLSHSGVLQTTGRYALQRINNLQSRRKVFRLDAFIGSILYIKKAFVDPDRFLARLDRYVSWMYSRGYVIAFGVAMAVTLVMLAGHARELAEHGANFFTLQNLAITWVVFVFVKTMHEMGHGMTCKHFGGEVHEMGGMLIMFTPYLYCNVSDSWLLPDKSKRILVTAAGIFVEMTLAIVAAWVWMATAPGLLHQVCFNIIFTCSVTTLLFNANPLMKFDGYYMMADVLEVPNLKQKSNAAASGWAQRYLLGLRGGGPAQFFSHELGPLFGLYAVASYFYGWFVLYRISYRMFDLLAPYGLDFLSHSYVWLYLFTALALPCYRLMKTTYQNPLTRAAAGRRFAQIGVGLAAAFLLSWFLPWQDSVKRGAVLEHAAVETVTTRTAGFLREVYVREGQPVHAGQALARLENPELQADADELEGEATSYDVQRRAALSDPQEATREMAAGYAKLAEETRTQLDLRRWQIAECTLRAPRDGVVREQNLDNLVGQFFVRGRPFCEIGSQDEYRAIISLDETEARRVAVGQTAKLRLRSLSAETFDGTITSAPVSSLAKLSVNGSANLTGGDVPTTLGRDGQFEPSVAYYEAEMLIRDPQGQHLRAGLTGMARVQTGRTTLGRVLVSRVLELINPAIRL